MCPKHVTARESRNAKKLPHMLCSCCGVIHWVGAHINDNGTWLDPGSLQAKARRRQCVAQHVTAHELGHVKKLPHMPCSC